MPKSISVIIPVFNSERFISEAIQSVIDQNYEPLQVIIVDDGSTDDTADIIAAFGKEITYLFQNNAGPAAARNKGLEMATGNFIAFLDSDDLWPENKLMDALAEFEKNPSLGFVQGLTRQVYDRRYGLDTGNLIKKEETLFVFLLGSAMFRKSAFDQIGGFDESMKYCEDLDWFLRAIEEEIPFIIHEKTSLIYRIHGGNLTTNVKQTDLSLFVALKKSISRRRKTGKGPLNILGNITNNIHLKDFLSKTNMKSANGKL